MSRTLESVVGRPWKKPPLVQRPWLRWLLIVGFACYLVASFMTIEVNWSRVYEGLGRGKQFILAFTSPDFTSRSGDIWDGMLESIIMTIAASVVGIGISIPIALGAARNVAPLPIYLDLPRDHRDQRRVAGNHRRDPPGRDLRVWSSGRVSSP